MGCAASAEADAPRPTNKPVTEAIAAAAAISPRRMCDGCARILGRLLCAAMVAEMGQLDEDADGRGDGEAPPCKPSKVVGTDTLVGSGSGGKVFRGLVGS
jgi:hypothetical protein